VASELKKSLYQKIYCEGMQNIYDMKKRRELSMAEFALAIYLRGKAQRLGNPFYQSDENTCNEISESKKVLRRLRKLLQIKGLIKFDVFHH